MTTVAVILAAGEGSRFARGAKLRADLRGRPLVAWAVEAAREAGLADTIVVTGAQRLDDLLPDDVTVVPNPDWARGQASSLRVGIQVADTGGYDALVVGLADTPFVTAECWAAVAGAETDVATATYDGDPRPPVRLARAVWDQVPASGDAGARRLVRGEFGPVQEIPCDGRAVDIDTMEDLWRWS